MVAKIIMGGVFVLLGMLPAAWPTLAADVYLQSRVTLMERSSFLSPGRIDEQVATLRDSKTRSIAVRLSRGGGLLVVLCGVILIISALA